MLLSQVLLLFGWQVNFQADIQDQTIGSATYGDYPDFIWVNQGKFFTVGGGPILDIIVGEIWTNQLLRWVIRIV